MTKTLFCEALGRTAVLVEKARGKRVKKTMQFRDAHAALDWRETNRVCLVYLPTPILTGN